MALRDLDYQGRVQSRLDDYLTALLGRGMVVSTAAILATAVGIFAYVNSSAPTGNRSRFREPKPTCCHGLPASGHPIIELANSRQRPRP